MGQRVKEGEAIGLEYIPSNFIATSDVINRLGESLYGGEWTGDELKEIQIRCLTPEESGGWAPRERPGFVPYAPEDSAAYKRGECAVGGLLKWLRAGKDMMQAIFIGDDGRFHALAPEVFRSKLGVSVVVLAFGRYGVPTPSGKIKGRVVIAEIDLKRCLANPDNPTPHPDAEDGPAIKGADSASPAPKKRPGRRAGDGAFDDGPLLEEMRKLISEGGATSAYNAAEQVAEKAKGGGTYQSKITRLHSKFKKSELK